MLRVILNTNHGIFYKLPFRERAGERHGVPGAPLPREHLTRLI